jgi:hypothetical protein
MVQTFPQLNGFELNLRFQKMNGVYGTKVQNPGFQKMNGVNGSKVLLHLGDSKLVP